MRKMVRNLSLKFHVTRFEVIKSTGGIREINFFFNRNGKEEKIVMWGPSLERYWNRVWTELGMNSMNEYLTALLPRLLIIISLKHRGDLKVSLGRTDSTHRYTIYESFEDRSIQDEIVGRVTGRALAKPAPRTRNKKLGRAYFENAIDLMHRKNYVVSSEAFDDLDFTDVLEEGAAMGEILLAKKKKKSGSKGKKDSQAGFGNIKLKKVF